MFLHLAYLVIILPLLLLNWDTDASSVLSAVEGLESVSSISHAGLMGIASALLIFVFAIQPFGTHKIAFAFSPVILLWLIAIFSIGIWNITKYPQIFAALSPHYAALYFKTGLPAWLSMGNILLVSLTICSSKMSPLTWILTSSV